MILVTGFDPFGDEPWNASFEAVRGLEGEVIEGRAIAARCLPTEYEAGPRVLAALVAALDPEIVVVTGQAKPDDPVRLETTFFNEADASRSDNAGRWPDGLVIDPAGESVRGSLVPLDRVASALDPSTGAVLSDDAGRFVCNAVGYRLAELGRPAIFVHVPSYGSRDEAGRRALESANRAAIRAVVAALLRVVSGPSIAV